MAKRIKIKAGNSTIDMSPEISAMTEELVNKLLPDTRRKLEKELQEVEDDARKRWLVRQKKYGESQDSRGKLYSDIAITSDFKLVGVVGNKAEYAWAIKVGQKTGKSLLNTGKRLSNELLFKPVKNEADSIAETLANEIAKKLAK